MAFMFMHLSLADDEPDRVVNRARRRADHDAVLARVRGTNVPQREPRRAAGQAHEAACAAPAGPGITLTHAARAVARLVLLAAGLIAILRIPPDRRA